MNQDIFKFTKNFTFSENDRKAQVKIQQMIKQARSHMPEQFYTVYNLIYGDQARKTRLFKQMKTIPKGCMHHLHIDCTQDQEFYREHIITDPNVYLNTQMTQLRLGTKQQAAKQKWISMKQARTKFSSEDQFVKKVSNITMFNKQQIKIYAGNQKQIWDAFQVKICNFFVIYFALHIFKKYIKHVLRKYIKNGYDRIQFRALLVQLNQYNESGQLVKTHDQKMFLDAIDEVYNQIKKQSPSLTIGLIFFGLKVFSDEQNQAIFTKVCDYNWDKTIGFDFVQQQDLYGQLDSYDQVVDRVFARYPHLNYKKVYHAGETRDHLTRNIEIAIKSGSVRIGHGLNILQRPQYLPYCRNICFEKNPISNLILGYISDTRLSSCPVLLGLGYPVTINPDDPGKFGLEDNSMDYFVSACSYNWTLKHLKLIGIHSINHAICSQSIKEQLLKSFTHRWDKWVNVLIKDDQILANPFLQDLTIFSSIKNWSFSQKQMQAQRKFTDLISETRDIIPQDFYHNDKFLLNISTMKQTNLFKWLKTIPKSVLQHNHFNCNQDFDFYKNHLLLDPNLYLNKQRTMFKYGNQKQAQQNKWISVQSLKSQYNSQDQWVQAISNLSIFSEEQFKQYSGIIFIYIQGKQKKIWELFQNKMDAFNPIIQILHFFKPYVHHVIMKFIKNNYDRIEIRAKIQNLIQYDKQGNQIKKHSYKKFLDIIDEVVEQISKKYPDFTIGFIFAGLKANSDQKNQAMFDQICQLNWNKTLGFDFVQEQSLYGSLEKYNNILDKVLKKYPHLDYKKVYHAGQSKDQNNRNLQIAIQSGSVRIGDGINALQRIQYLANCKNICFEKNPTTNLILGYSGDSRTTSAPVLLGLGFAVTINSDDPGKFRLQDATSDYFLSAVSYKWRLRHFKLIALHSLNHALCPLGQKLVLQQLYNKKWNQWIDSFIKAKLI